MRDFVKKFIENNIQYIASSDWTTLFSNWEDKCKGLWLNDDNEFEELMSILDTIQKAPSEESRKQALKSIIRSKIKQSTPEELRTSYLTFMLNSFLGFSTKEVNTLVMETAKEMGINL